MTTTSSMTDQSAKPDAWVEMAMKLAQNCESWWYRYCDAASGGPNMEASRREYDFARDALRSHLLARPPAGQEPVAKEKIAPVQGYTPGIPWSIHLEAYDAYSKKWAPQPALIDLEGRGCRGGFSTGELDDFVPGWRDRVSEIGRLRAQVAQLQATPSSVEAMREAKEADDDTLNEMFFAQVKADRDVFRDTEETLAAVDYFKHGYRAAIAKLEAAIGGAK